MERLYIVDGFNYIFRAYYGMAASRLTTDNMPTGALYVYASMLIRLHEEVRPERIVVVFDAPGPTFRDSLFPDYKAHRGETPDDLKVQIPFFRPLTEAFHWPVVSVPGVEADDTIATIARHARDRGWDVVIYSGDKDLMQLVDEHTMVVDSMRNVNYDTAGVKEKFEGTAPSQLVDYLALVGDTSDNIPGMPGVGKKTAAKLLAEYGSIAGILANVEQMKGKQKERFSDPELVRQLKLSRELVVLKTDVTLPADVDTFRQRPWDSERLLQLFERFQFGGLIRRLRGRTSDKAENKDTKSSRPKNAQPVSCEALPGTVTTDPEVIFTFVERARNAGCVAIHAEGDGARHDRERLVALCLGVSGQGSVYVPIQHRYLGAPLGASVEVLKPIAEILEDDGVSIVCHDAKRLRQLLVRQEIGLGGVCMDTLLAAYLLNPSGDSRNVDSALRSVLGIDLPSREALVGKGKKAVSWEMIDVEHGCAWASQVVAALLQACQVLLERLDELGMRDLFAELELPLTRVLAVLEMRGICLDKDALGALRDEVGAKIAELESAIFEKAGGPFNLGSPKQLSALLFDTLKLQSPVMKKTKTGYSTDHEVLEAMADLHPIISPILEHRELVKLKGTYIDALPPMVNPETHRLHTTFRQDVAATGRLSSQDPNLQNIPIRTELGRSIRRAFVAKPEHVLISADYSQIELRVMAHLSEDPVLLRAFRDKVDVHQQTASEVFEVPADYVSHVQRRIAKAVNYGLIYGQSEFGLGRALGISRTQAREYIRRYFERFSGVQAFMREAVHKAREEGGARSICGRLRPIPGLSSSSARVRSTAERIAQNTPLQGSAADILKLAMLKIDELLAASGANAEMLLTVHDELIIEVSKDEAEELSEQVRSAMEGAMELRVPLVVDIGIAPNWADAH